MENKKSKLCTRNPGHKSLIPVKDFKISHLPPAYQQKEFYDYTIAISDLTVKLTVSFVSLARPEGEPFRGKKVVRVGSGMVFRVRENSSIPCAFCQNLMGSSETNRTCTLVDVRTAHHVVFDNEEASHTKVDLFYDEATSLVKRLSGVQVIDENPELDTCVLVCIIHDQSVSEKLKELIKKLEECEEMCWNETSGTGSSEPLVVTSSHPHGLPKRIQVGHFLHHGHKDCAEMYEDEASASSSSESLFVISSHPHGLPKRMQLGQFFGRKDSEFEGMDVRVRFPDHTDKLCVIWALNITVKKMKGWLLKEGGIGVRNIPPDQVRLIIHMSENAAENIEMNENQQVEYYLEELSQARELEIKRLDGADE